MDHLIWLFVVVVLLAGGLVSVSIWSRRRTWAKLLAILLGALFIPAAYAGYVGLLSKPRPMELEWLQRLAPEATVLGARIHEGEGIYLWLQIDGIAEPRSYVIGWDRDLAEQLQQALQEADTNRSGVRMRLPYEKSWSQDRPPFYALPQPAFPPKDQIPSTAPMDYEHPDFKT
ncbi:MAG: hypothetical protein V3V17_00855 [Alphaproteobacteria bacterium]